MGGNRAPHRARSATRGAAALLAVLGIAACDGDDGDSTDVVGPADAITAIVAWQAAEQEPVLDDDGEAKLPVIFVVAGDGATIDVGVQAEVAAATVDTATVRFADDVADTFDAGLEGEPVREDGVMVLLGPMPEPEEDVTLVLDRYEAIDEWETLQLDITAAGEAPDTTDGATPSASVTSVTRL